MKIIPRPLLLFLYSTPNIVGSILGLVGLALFFAGVIKSYWWFIVAGLYAIGLLATPRSPTQHLQLNHELSVAELREALENLVASIRRRVSPEILAKVQGISSSILEILPRIDDVNSGDYNAHVIRQTVLDYLPQTLQNYLNLPPAFALVHPVKNGKTAKQLLLEQLDLLDRKMGEIVETVNRNDTQRLLVQGRFLEQTFGRADEWLGGN